MEGWLSLSIYLSATILILSLAVCLPDIVHSILRWLQSETPTYRFGELPHTQASAFVVLCEFLTTISGAYLVVALFIRSNTT